MSLDTSESKILTDQIEQFIHENSYHQNQNHCHQYSEYDIILMEMIKHVEQHKDIIKLTVKIFNNFIADDPRILAK